MPEEPLMTTNAILLRLKGWVENAEIHSPSEWVNEALNLTTLEGDEADELFTLQQKVSRMQFEYLGQTEKRNVSEAKAYIQTTDEYLEMRKLEAKIKRIQELVRIAKVQARLRADEVRGY